MSRICSRCGRPKEEHLQRIEVLANQKGEVLSVPVRKGSSFSRECPVNRLNTVGEGKPQRHSAIEGRR